MIQLITNKFHKIIIFLFLALLLGCSSEFSNPPPRAGGLAGGGISYTPTQEFGTLPSALYPWERWEPGFDLSGATLIDPFIVKGDEAVRKGERLEALGLYRRAWGPTQPFIVKEALALRISGTQLALDQARDSLITLSQFFRENGVDINSVKAPIALVFAYAYGRTGDMDQSLAWFSRLNSMVDGRGGMSNEAKTGASLLLRTKGDEELVSLSGTWAADSFVASVIGQERARRARLGGSAEIAPKDKPFWLAVGPRDSSPAMIGMERPGVLPADPLREVVVGTLLPTSGRFSKLGESAQRGIEMAFTDTPFPVKVLAQDTAGDPTTAITASDNLLATVRPAVVLGPLLSDPAAAVVPILRERGIPEITFSRKDSPGYGQTAFRLGATSESQVRSLFSVAESQLGVGSIAIIYPQDSNGYEFIRDSRSIAAELGMSIVYETAYGEEFRESFVNIAKEIESANPSAIFFPDEIDKANVLVSNLSPFFKKKVKILGSAAWDNLGKLGSARTLLEGCVFVSPFFAKSDRELVRRFVSIFKTTYGTDPDFLAAQGFDAATMALAALSREVNEGIPFADAFRAIENYEGLTGKMRVRSDGAIERQYAIVQLTDTGLVELNTGASTR